MKNTASTPMPRPAGQLLFGAMIGGVIITMATQAILVGAGAALADATLKRR